MRTLLVVAVCFGLCGANTFAQDSPAKTPEQIAAQQVIDQLNAEKALLDAQTAKFKAEQDAEKARKQVEIDRLTAEKALLDAQTAGEKSVRQDEIDKIKAQKDLITAATPNITGAPKGTVTFDDKGTVTIENTVKAYEAVRDAAATIAAGIVTGSPADKVYVILGTGDTTALAGLSVFEAQASLIKKRLLDIDHLKDDPGMTVPTEESGPQSFAAALALAGPAINAVTGLVSLFKVDDKFMSKDETPDLPALYGAVAAQMRTHGAVSIYYPEIMPAHLFEAQSPVQATLTEVVDALDKLRGTYFSRLADRAKGTKLAADADDKIAKAPGAIKAREEITAIEKQINALGTSPADVKRKKALEALKAEKLKLIPEGAIDDETLLDDKKKYRGALKSFIDANERYIALLEPVLKAGDEYMAAMTKSDVTSTSPLMALITAERLRRVYTEKPATTYAVQVGLQKLSGSRKEHTNFFGTSVSFSGGVVVSYRVFEASSGKLIASETVPIVKPFTKVREQ